MVGIIDDNQLIVLHETPVKREGWYSLASMLTSAPLGGIVVDGLLANVYCSRVYLAAPAAWELKVAGKQRHVVSYNNHIPLTDGYLQDRNSSYLILSNGRFYTDVDYRWLRKVVLSFGTDVVLVNVEPTLSANQEKLQLTSQGQLAGVRRVYSDSAQRAPMPVAWPCHVFISKSCLHGILKGGSVSADFDNFIRTVSKNATVSSVSVGGTVLDIETPQGLLSFVTKAIKSPKVGGRHNYSLIAMSALADALPSSTKCHGEVVIGQNVRIGENVRLVGPAIIGDNAAIGDGATVSSSIVDSGVHVGPQEVVHDQLLVKSSHNGGVQKFEQRADAVSCRTGNNFKIWPRLSYARFVKRTADIMLATAVLILFAPVIAIIAPIIKATSRGPVFFGHLRQGLHGKSFRCLKFRSMIVGADELQRKLRMKNEVDGPQFKMCDDPRVTPMGKFLRDTYLDEIPQFFNVLVGNMSVVGPRPSPEAENSLCAYWRDARLSVRPGITGLWQVCRTRQAGSDFQEWVHYDSQYVRQLSLKLDLWIFWQTTQYLVKTFLRQF